MTAWTQRPEDEHPLLSALLYCFLRNDAVPADLLGPLAETGLPVALNIALPPPEDRSFADVWSALGGELKPFARPVVVAPADGGRRLPGDRRSRKDSSSRSATEPNRRSVGPTQRRSPMTDASLDAPVGPDRGRRGPGAAGRGGATGGRSAAARSFRGLYVSDDAVARLLSATREPLRPERHRSGAACPSPRTTPTARPTTGGTSGCADSPTRSRSPNCYVDRLPLLPLPPDLDNRFEWDYELPQRRCHPPPREAVGLAFVALRGADCGGAGARSGSRRQPARSAADSVGSRTASALRLSRGLRVPDRVASHLLGDDGADADAGGCSCCRSRPAKVATMRASRRPQSAAGRALVYVRERPVAAARPPLCTRARSAGQTSVLLVDLETLLGQAGHGARRRPRGTA